MPWSRLLLPGIAGLLMSACAASAGSPAPLAGAAAPATPAPVTTPPASSAASNGPWSLNLDFSGELAGHVTGTAPSDSVVHNDCTGSDSPRLGSWASTMAFDLGPQRYVLYLLVKDYKGAAAFNSGVQIEVSSADQSQVWQNEPADPVTFTVGADQESGLLEAELSNVADTTKKLDVGGHWSCHP